MLPNICVDVADFYTHHSDGTSVEVRKHSFLSLYSLVLPT